MTIANVATSDTFNVWVVKTNQVIALAEQANTIAVIANSRSILAYGQANTGTATAIAAFTHANAINSIAVAAFAHANAVNSIAVAAFAKANTGLSNTSNAVFAGDLIITGNVTVQGGFLNLL